jgi:3-oxoacyl-[acyl-carrier-protein] synthase-3
MQLGIKNIGVYLPEGRASNLGKLAEFEIDETFITEKIGVRSRSIMAPGESTTDLCVRAFADLELRGGPVRESVDCVVVVTQNPGANIPHLSARVHAALNLPERCACFDISLGCSGYVYGLSAIQAFMDANKLSNGLLFTCDPYSPIIDEADKNTSMLFGDAASVTWISKAAELTAGRFTFGTLGSEHAELTCASPAGSLTMNGRAVFNFAARYVPADIKQLLEINAVSLAAVDRFIFHQGSKYIVDTLRKLLRLDAAKVPFDIMEYGNTVSSSIPIILAKDLGESAYRTFVLCGFGAGLSWASVVLTRPSDI